MPLLLLSYIDNHSISNSHPITFLNKLYSLIFKLSSIIFIYFFSNNPVILSVYFFTYITNVQIPK